MIGVDSSSLKGLFDLVFLTIFLQPEERAQFEILKAQMFAERAAKRERRPKRARAMVEEETASTGHNSTSVPKNIAPIKLYRLAERLQE